MRELMFDWNVSKNRQNQRKHGISFEEAMTVFYDENALEFFDSEHSGAEDRFLMLGVSHRLRVLMVSYCLREHASVIRIISARKATAREQEYYPRGKR